MLMNKPNAYTKQNRNRRTDTENELMLPKGKGWGSWGKSLGTGHGGAGSFAILQVKSRCWSDCVPIGVGDFFPF